MVTSQSEPVFTLPTAAAELVAEFDPLSVTTSKFSTAADDQDVFVEEATGNDLTEPEDVGRLPEAEQTESLRSDAAHTLTEVVQYNGAFVVDPTFDGWSQSLVSSAESDNHEGCDNMKELSSKPCTEFACSSQDTAGGSKCVSRDGRDSYLEVWTCSSSLPSQNKAETGLSSDAAVFLPLQREMIKSDDSDELLAPSPPASASYNSEDVVLCSPPVPKKRSLTQLSTSDQSVKPSPSFVPTRVAPAPPCHGAEIEMPADSSTRMDEDASVVGGEVAAPSSHSPGLPAAPEGDSRFVSSSSELPWLLSVEEEQVCSVPFPPRARPRESQRLVTNGNVYSPSRIQGRLQPLVMPTAVQQPSTSTPTSPLDKVIAVGGVNILAMKGAAAAGNSSKTSTSSEVLSPVTPSSTRTPPVPPPKLRRTPEVKSEEHFFSTAVDDYTTDEDADNGDVNNSKF